MQKHPNPRPRPETLRTDRIEQIVQSYNGHSDGADHAHRQTEQTGQDDHAPAKHPDHLTEIELIVKVETDIEPDHRDFQDHQPKSARYQEPGQFRPWLIRKIRSGTCEKHKHRRAEMRDPAS